MSNGHTPGPWCVESGAHYRAVRTGGEVIANMREIGGCFNEANARLISAAPELLEALELLSQSAPAASCEMFHHEKKDRHTFIEECPALTRYEHACLKARAAIAKARGTPC